MAVYIMSEFVILPEAADVERSAPLYVQIRETLRAAIASGRLTPGTRLPTSRELAAHFGTGTSAVQAALSALAEEGLVDRKQRRGTFVNGGTIRLTTAAVYLSAEVWRSESYGFARQLYVALEQRLHRLGVQVETFMDTRMQERRTGRPDTLLAAIEARRVQALIEPLPPEEYDPEALSDLGIPVATFSVRPSDYAVTHDWDQLVATLLEHWRRRGVRSAGIVSHAVQMRPYAERLAAQARAVGIAMRPEWLRLPDHVLRAEDYEGFGYRQFRSLWRGADRPQALFVFADLASRGLITATLELGVDVPGDLDLTIFENAGAPLLCPHPVARIGGDAEETADALLAKIHAQIAGEPIERTLLPLRLRQDDQLTNHKPPEYGGPS